MIGVYSYIPAKLEVDSGLMSLPPQLQTPAVCTLSPGTGELPSLDPGDGVAASERQQTQSYNAILF